MAPRQEMTIFKTFKRSIGSTMRTYLLENVKVAKKNINQFDRNIKNISTVSYDRLNADRFIKLTRLFNYNLVPEIKIAYGMWVKYKY